VDVAEVRLQTLARIVIERDERLTLRPLLSQQVEPDALIAARVAVLVAQAAEQLGDRMPLLARRLFVRKQNGVDDRLERIDHRRHGLTFIGLRFGLGKDLADLASRVLKTLRQGPDA
jgi:hypothetical protein